MSELTTAFHINERQWEAFNKAAYGKARFYLPWLSYGKVTWCGWFVTLYAPVRLSWRKGRGTEGYQWTISQYKIKNIWSDVMSELNKFAGSNR